MIQQIIIGLGLIFGFVGCLFNPFIGMLTLMGINMIQPGELYSVFNALHVERVMALLTIVMVLARGPKFAFPPVTRWCLWFYGAVVASIPLAFWISNAVANAEEFAKTIILSVLLVTLITSRERLRTVLITFSGLVGYLAATSLIAYAQGNFQTRMNVDRAVGFTSASNNPDTLGLTIATALPLIYILSLKPSSAGVRWAMRLIMAVCLMALLLTGSRGSLLTFVLILLLGIVRSRRRLLILPLSVALSLAIWSALPAQYKARYSSVDHLQHDDSYQMRIISWEGGWAMFLHNPLTGVGVGNYTDANGARYWPGPRKVYLDAHSLYLKCLGELGLLGVVTFAGFVVVFFKTNHALKAAMAARLELPAWMRLYPTACSLALIGLLYCGYAYHDLYRTTWYFLAAVTGALDIIVSRELATEPATDGEAPALPARPSLAATTQWAGARP